MRLNHYNDADLISVWRRATKILNRYQTKRAFIRLFLIVQQLDERGI